MKIAILGTSGSGKSTLAKRLGERYGLPVLHMDTVHFLPGWVERPFAEEEAMVRQFLDENAGGWVIDGNYTKTCYARRLEEADKIIVLWFSPLVCLWRAVRRWPTSSLATLAPAEGCPSRITAAPRICRHLRIMPCATAPTAIMRARRFIRLATG